MCFSAQPGPGGLSVGRAWDTGNKWMFSVLWRKRVYTRGHAFKLLETHSCQFLPQQPPQTQLWLTELRIFKIPIVSKTKDWCEWGLALPSTCQRQRIITHDWLFCDFLKKKKKTFLHLANVKTRKVSLRFVTNEMASAQCPCWVFEALFLESSKWCTRKV